METPAKARPPCRGFRQDGTAWTDRFLGESIGEGRENRFGLGRLDVAAHPGAASADQGGQRRHRDDASRVVIGKNGHRVAERLGFSGRPPQAGQRGGSANKRPVPHPGSPRAGVAQGAGTGDHDPRVDLAEAVVADPESFHRARLEIRQHQVRGSGQLFEYRCAVRITQVQPEPQLVAVAPGE
jgi:hypothetical protein